MNSQFLRPCLPIVIALLGVIFGPPLVAASATTGAIEGRVFNAATGSALANARIRIEGTALESLTDERGSYRLAAVPAGEVQVVVSYLGFAPQTATVRVAPGAAARREFELTLARATVPRAEGEVVKLQEFNVVADREMSAQAVAVNEQRFAPNIKSVVAIDEFGDLGNESIMNFLQFLPAVSVVDDAVGAGSVSLRGFPAGNTVIAIDGADFASSREGITSRGTTLLEVPMSNISRVEVTKVPTPDMAASGLGGSINIISKRGFEARRPQFAYSVYTLFRDDTGLRFDTVRRNHIPQLSPQWVQPSADFSYQHPLNKSLSFTVGGSRTWRIKEMNDDDDTDETSTWDLIGAPNGGTVANPKPIQTRGIWQNLAQVVKTESFNAGADWQITSKDSVQMKFNYRDTYNLSTRSYLDVNYGAGAIGDSNFTQGASNAAGSIGQGTNAMWLRLTKSVNAVAKYSRIGEAWKLDAMATASKSDTVGRELEEGSFGATPATISGLILRGEGRPTRGSNLMHKYTATLRDGTPVDIFDGGNYVLGNPTTGVADRWNNNRMTVRANLGREAFSRLPLTLKGGVAVNIEERSGRRPSQTWNFRPRGATDNTSRLAKNFDVFDDAFNATAPTVYGQRMRWISSAKLFQLFQQHPDWFVPDEVGAHTNLVTNSRVFTETVSAAYLRGDLRLLQNRLWLVGGVRFERTEVEGWGPVNDINATYQRRADGSFILDSAGRKILITTNALEQAHLRYRERAGYGKSDYDGYYPSLNASYNISDNLVLRGAFARTIGRPTTGSIIPGTTISAPDVADPLITVSNPNLQPWTATSYDLSLESYFLKNGFGSVGVFQKNISNFFGSADTPATPELLEQLGLGGDPSLLGSGYDIRTSFNGGEARLEGVEFSYRQSLTFLPGWARGVQILGNATKMWLHGQSITQFTGFNPSNYSAGINLIRPRYFVKLTWKFQGDTRRSIQTPNATTPPDTYTYLGARTRWGLNVQYSLSKRYALYLSADDIGGGVFKNSLRYAPGTPEYAKPGRIYENGWYTTFGLRGQF